MRTFFKATAVVAASVVAAGVAFPGLATAAGEKVTDVVIRNTPDQPVPVQAVGNTPVTVNGTPSVNVGNNPTVTVGNTPSVTVGNTPDVKIANTAPIPVSGTLTTAGPVSFSKTTGGDSTASSVFGESYTIPAGKDLVLTYVNAQTRTFGAGQKTAFIGVTNGGGTFDTGITLPFELRSDGGAVASEQTQVVFRDRVFPYAMQEATATPQLFQLILTWTGYLVDEVPAG